MTNGRSLLILESTWDEKGHYLRPEISVRPFFRGITEDRLYADHRLARKIGFTVYKRNRAAPEVLASLPRNGPSRSRP